MKWGRIGRTKKRTPNHEKARKALPRRTDYLCPEASGRRIKHAARSPEFPVRYDNIAVYLGNALELRDYLKSQSEKAKIKRIG